RVTSRHIVQKPVEQVATQNDQPIEASRDWRGGSSALSVARNYPEAHDKWASWQTALFVCTFCGVFWLGILYLLF
ncbi:MAG: hypothetical protein V3V03_08635, partial [Hyphomonadaceae bacterium]